MGCFVNLLFSHWVIVSTGHFFNWSFCHFVIWSIGHFLDFSFFQMVTLLTGHYGSHQGCTHSGAHVLNLLYHFWSALDANGQLLWRNGCGCYSILLCPIAWAGDWGSNKENWKVRKEGNRQKSCATCSYWCTCWTIGFKRDNLY